MRRFMFCLAAMAGLALQATAADPAPGNWKVVTTASPTNELVDSIIKLEKKDGAWTVSVVAAGVTSGPRPPIPLKMQSVTINGDKIRIVGQRGNDEVVFEGKIDAAKNIVGNYGGEARIQAARLMWTEDDDIDAQSQRIVRSLPAPMREYNTLQQGVSSTSMRALMSKDAEEKKKAAEDGAAKQKELAAKGPPLLKKVLAEHADHPVAFDAAMLLIQNASRNNSSADDVKKWTESALAKAAKFGPRFQTETMINLAETLAKTPSLRNYAAEQAKKAEKELGPNGSTSRQIRVLTILAEAMKNDVAASKMYAERLEKLEAKLDVEYLAKHGKFEVQPYKGRKDGGSKTVLMELFTGAQCPPCVAADVAFDKLIEAYKPTDVILLQYHLHIPGPDPLTNADTVARAAYYGARSTPSTFFNGVAEARGGGGEAAAPNKLEQYRKVIDPILDDEGKGKLTLKVMRNGSAMTFDANVADLPDSDKKPRLYFALVEDSVRYVGSNGLRFHHHVVRALPGGAEGIELKGKSDSQQVKVDLTEVRSNLTKYLDQYAANRPFPKPQRPMEMKKLKAVAWVQDPESKAVLMAAEANVPDGPTGG